MSPGDEALSPAAAETPTPAMVLRWVKAADPGLWFPSAHAAAAGLPRDALDAPLHRLRAAGLVRVADWVRGAGQGFALTPAGEAALADPVALDRPPPAPPAAPAEPFAAPPEDDPGDPAPGLGRVALDLRPPVVTPALLFANLAWFVAGLAIADRIGVTASQYLADGGPLVLADGRPGALARAGAVSAADLLRGEWWRLVTNCFVHVGLVHLLGNLIALGMIGPLAEVLWGRWRLVVLYLLAGLGGSCLAVAAHPVSENGVPVTLAGASGAVWGLMASLLAWLLLYRDRLPPPLVAEWLRRLGYVFALNALVSLLPGVSWEAHVGGGLVGFVAAGLLNATRADDRRRRAAAGGLLLVVPVLCLGGLGLAMAGGHGAWPALRQREAAVAFNRDVAPALKALPPPVAEAAVAQAVAALASGHSSHLTAARERVAELRGLAAAAGDHLAGRAAGGPYHDDARAFVGSRAELFDRLGELLTADALPDAAAWRAVGESRRDGDRRWAELVGAK